MATPSGNIESRNAPGGFAGLASLVSELSEAPKATPEPAAQNDRHTTPDIAEAQDSSETPFDDAPSRPTPAEFPTRRQDPIWIRKPAAFWLTLAAVAAFIYLGYVSSHGPTAPPHPTSDPLFVQPAQQADATPQPKPYVAPPPAALPALAEVKPAGGANPVLSAPEILYCLSEDTRLGAMREILSDPSQIQINNFNARVSDFNAHCAAYRYYHNDMDRAKITADSRKTVLKMEAQRIVSGWR